MQFVRRYRIPALFCAFAVLVCELIARPFTTMGLCDDGPYILMAQHLATTGHIAYNGWATAMLGSQLYLGAAFIKLFGFSFTTVRMSTLLVAMATAFLLQRTLVRSGITERNATLATLALVLSPLYLMLSVTFMTDISGLFALIICLYGCLRALQASTSSATIAWLCFAVATNALCGTARQIAWLGILVMLPSTLWLLRSQRRVLLAGTAATLSGAIFIFACMQWFKHQPYSIPEQLLPKTFPVAHILSQLSHTFLDAPFLLLPLIALFLPQIYKARPRILALAAVVSLGYILLAIHQAHLHPGAMLEPTIGDWVNMHGILHERGLYGDPPVFLNTTVLVILTIVSIGGLLGLLISFLRSSQASPAPTASRISWKHIGVLLGPFTLAYVLLLVPRAATLGISDRYLIGILFVPLLCLVLYYQQRIQTQLPLISLLLVAIMAIYGIAVTHNTFSFYRARVALAAELRAAGIPDTSVDNGWEYNIEVELQHANHINYFGIVVPVHAYVPAAPLDSGSCPMFLFDDAPHIHPLYGVSFDPNACYGPAAFAPMHYSRWLASTPGTLFVIRYTPQSKP